MGGNPRSQTLSNIGFFLILLVAGTVFFHPVRDNPFWHPDDYEYLEQALATDASWTQLFADAPHETFQPVVNLVFFLEFKWFGPNPLYFYLFNIFVHAINAFLVFLLVWTLLRERTIALLSGVLFVFAVGNYGKAIMVVSGIGDLIITALTLLTMFFYVRNELDDSGRLWTRNFCLCLLFFALSLLSKATSFSILGCMFAFNVFFRPQSGRRILDPNVVFIGAFALVVLVLKILWLRSLPGASDLDIIGWSLPRNFAAYLVRMVFPIQFSTLVRDSGPIVQFVYNLATEIRILLFFCIVSFSVFGFVFGNKVIRFFIMWTYITVTPFCFFRFPADWLNIRYLYLVSVGFSMILASGTVLAARLLEAHRLRRLLPYAAPLLFVLLSQFVIVQLDRNYESKVKDVELQRIRAEFFELYDARVPAAK